MKIKKKILKQLKNSKISLKNALLFSKLDLKGYVMPLFYSRALNLTLYKLTNILEKNRNTKRKYKRKNKYNLDKKYNEYE